MVNLRETILRDGTLLRPHMDYVRHLQHTEEMQNVTRYSKIVFNPNDKNKLSRETNIEFSTGHNDAQDDEFYANVMSDLALRGISGEDLPESEEEQVEVLRKCLLLQYKIQRCRNAL